jgi:hypothetical protein
MTGGFMQKLGSGLLTVSLIACSADPGYEPRVEPKQSQPHVTSDFPRQSAATSIEAPQQLVVELQTCADKFALRLPKTANHYAVQYNLEVDGDGIKVKVKDSMISGSELESCLTKVFERMEITESMVSTSNVSPTSRSVVGIAQAAAPIALLPIILVAGGFTILLGVTIYVAVEAVEDVIEAAKRWRPKPTKNRCLDAAAGGTFLWYEFCRAIKDPIDAEGCWALAEDSSEQKKRNWCNSVKF